jgi:hypothetical protein
MTALFSKISIDYQICGAYVCVMANAMTGVQPMSNTLTADTSALEALFRIDMVDGAAIPDVNDWQKIKCRKCGGTGDFVGWSGKVVGKCFTCKGAGFIIPEKRDDGAAINVGRIEEAFASAFGKGIKRPKLRLGAFQFSRAPDTGKNAGSIYVKEGEQYLGKVTAGEFFPVRECGDERKAQVIEVAADPAKAAKAYGMRTGSCSCCGRELTNGVSIDLGIGPICASKFGWGA